MTDENIIEFFRIAGKLKKVERTGWVTQVGIPNPESVAEHSFRAAIIGMLISDIKKMDTEKVMRMLLLHDIAETIIGDWDLSAKKKLGIEKWKDKEIEAFDKIMQMLPQSLKEDYIAIWKEFEERKTEEAEIAYQSEKLEMILQALEYMEEGYDKEKLNSFFENEKDKFTDSDIKALFEILDKRRKTNPDSQV
ncbi:MAG: HD domain-containing protein [Candidatus Aenigmatarchaeota archaeon]